MKILVIDDAPTIRTYVTRALKGYAEVTTASNVENAKNLFCKDCFDLALVDVNLGTENGIPLAIWLRDMDPRLVVVVMSGDPSNENVVRSAGLGDMLQKPFTFEELKRRLI